MDGKLDWILFSGKLNFMEKTGKVDMATELRDLPSEVLQRLTEWRRYFKGASRAFYAAGIIGVACSATAAALPSFIDYGQDFSRGLSAISAVCFAVLGFAQPDRMYMKFVRAWRLLDVAAMRYRYGEIDSKDLFQAVADSEASLSRFEDDYPKRPGAGSARK